MQIIIEFIQFKLSEMSETELETGWKHCGKCAPLFVGCIKLCVCVFLSSQIPHDCFFCWRRMCAICVPHALYTFEPHSTHNGQQKVAAFDSSIYTNLIQHMLCVYEVLKIDSAFFSAHFLNRTWTKWLVFDVIIAELHSSSQAYTAFFTHSLSLSPFFFAFNWSMCLFFLFSRKLWDFSTYFEMRERESVSAWARTHFTHSNIFLKLTLRAERTV